MLLQQHAFYLAALLPARPPVMLTASPSPSARSVRPVFDGQPYELSLLPASARRAALVVGGSATTAAVALPNLPDWVSFDAASFAAPPLLTMGAMGALVVVSWRAFGTDLHPITAKARGIKPPPALAFQCLGLSGALLGSAAIAFGWYPLPVAGSPVELAHCALPLLLWKADVQLVRWLNPHVQWQREATDLHANYRAEHASLLAAAVACLGVICFETYVQQVLAAPLTLAGWPLIASAALIASSAGLMNHAFANGLLNGVLCAEFYWTVSLMFGVSNSVLPVGLYHHLMYSMPIFVQRYDEAVESAPSPLAHAVLLHATLAAWHLAAFSCLATLAPQAMELRPALDEGLSLLPSSLGAGAGLACFGLFTAAAISTAAAAVSGGAGDAA
jgi:hypothetical protein